MNIELLRATLKSLPVGQVITKRQLREIGIELTDFQKLVDLDLFATIEPHCAWRYHTARLTFEEVFRSIEAELGDARVGGLAAMLFHSAPRILFLPELCRLFVRPNADCSEIGWAKSFSFALCVDDLFDFNDEEGVRLDKATTKDVMKGVRYSGPGRALLEYLAQPEEDPEGNLYIPPKSYLEEYEDEIQALVPYCKNKAVMQRLSDWYDVRI